MHPALEKEKPRVTDMIQVEEVFRDFTQPYAIVSTAYAVLIDREVLCIQLPNPA
jgi:hypothetical protein